MFFIWVYLYWLILLLLLLSLYIAWGPSDLRWCFFVAALLLLVGVDVDDALLFVESVSVSIMLIRNRAKEWNKLKISKTIRNTLPPGASFDFGYFVLGEYCNKKMNEMIGNWWSTGVGAAGAEGRDIAGIDPVNVNPTHIVNTCTIYIVDENTNHSIDQLFVVPSSNIYNYL